MQDDKKAAFFAAAKEAGIATAKADIGIQLTPQNSPRTIKMLAFPLCLSSSQSILSV